MEKLENYLFLSLLSVIERNTERQKGDKKTNGEKGRSAQEQVGREKTCFSFLLSAPPHPPPALLNPKVLEAPKEP
jgi:hypothetical protein